MRNLLLALMLSCLATVAQASDLHATYNGRFVHLSVNGTFPSYQVERATGDGEFELLLLDLTGCTGICNYDDLDLSAGAHYRYRIRVPREDGSFDLYGPTDLELAKGMALSFHSVAVPNPAPARTRIHFTVPAAVAGSGEVPITVVMFDASGREMARLWESTVGIGDYEVVWDGS
ncbi:MAG: hypothetical protein KC729_19770, partial [Candidatus Eisenbacteria bacterium]|nr:hypothetical protein [Candidatus Eisenbacteria bacterium]